MFESLVIDWLLRTDLQAVAQMLDLSWGVSWIGLCSALLPEASQGARSYTL